MADLARRHRTVGRVLAVADVALAVAVLVMLAYAVTHADRPQYDGRAMGARAICFPVALLIVPIGVLVTRRRRLRRADDPAAARFAYPHLLGVLVTLPFAIDLAGNAFRLYIEITHFDDVVHTVNPVLFVAAIALLLAGAGLPTWGVVLAATGLGSTGHILWELIEYVVLVKLGAVELGLTLEDTLSDLSWGLVGSVVGTAIGVAGARLVWPARALAAGSPEAR